MDIFGQLLVNALISGSLYALASAGLALTYGLLKSLNFAHGHLMMVGAYVLLVLHVDPSVCAILAPVLPQAGLSWVAALPLLVAVGAVLGAITLVVFMRPFARVHPLLTLVSTLSLATMIEAAVAYLCGVNVRSLSVGDFADSIEFAGIFVTKLQMVIVVVALVVLSLLALALHSTGLGRAARALSEHSFACQSLGISSARLEFVIVVVATLLAMLAGILVGYETNLQPTMGNAYTIKAVSAMILGGLGSVWGTVVGAYILGTVENFAVGLDLGAYSIPSGYKDAFAYLIIVVMLLVRPQGLFGKRIRKV